MARRACCSLAQLGPVVSGERRQGREDPPSLAVVTRRERAGQTIRESAAYLGADGRSRGGVDPRRPSLPGARLAASIVIQGEDEERLCSGGRVPNFVPSLQDLALYLSVRVVAFLNDSAWYRRWDSNPQTLPGSGF